MGSLSHSSASGYRIFQRFWDQYLQSITRLMEIVFNSYIIIFLEYVQKQASDRSPCCHKTYFNYTIFNVVFHMVSAIIPFGTPFLVLSKLVPSTGTKYSSSLSSSTALAMLYILSTGPFILAWIFTPIGTSSSSDLNNECPFFQVFVSFQQHVELQDHLNFYMYLP